MPKTLCQGTVGGAGKQCCNLATEKRRTSRLGPYSKVTRSRQTEMFYVKLCPFHTDEWDNKKDEKAKERKEVA